MIGALELGAVLVHSGQPMLPRALVKLAHEVEPRGR
jgi:hypothetical protein